MAELLGRRAGTTHRIDQGKIWCGIGASLSSAVKPSRGVFLARYTAYRIVPFSATFSDLLGYFTYCKQYSA